MCLPLSLLPSERRPAHSWPTASVSQMTKCIILTSDGDWSVLSGSTGLSGSEDKNVCNGCLQMGSSYYCCEPFVAFHCVYYEGNNPTEVKKTRKPQSLDSLFPGNGRWLLKRLLPCTLLFLKTRLNIAQTVIMGTIRAYISSCGNLYMKR